MVNPFGYSPDSFTGSLTKPVVTKEDALKDIRDNSLAFIALGILTIVLGLFLTGLENWATGTLISGSVACILGALLLWLKSRAIAWLLVAYAALGLLSTVNNLLFQAGSGKNVVLSALMVWFAYRSVSTTKKLTEYKRKAES